MQTTTAHHPNGIQRSIRPRNTHNSQGLAGFAKGYKWFSTTTNRDVALDGFTNKNEYLFKIHLINVKCIDINYYKIAKNSYKDEKEFICLGDGTFYQDAKLTREGFLDIGIEHCKTNKNIQMYECWYTPNVPHSLDEPSHQSPIQPRTHEEMINSAVHIIGDEELDSADDVFVPQFPLTMEDKIEIYNRLKQHKKTGGQKKKRRRRRSKRAKGQFSRKSKRSRRMNVKK